MVRGFSLIEALVVVGILAALLSLIVPALTSARDQMKSLMCTSKLRAITYKFYLFSEDESPEGRGGSARLARNEFWLDDFQASMYGIDSFWRDATMTKIDMQARDELMMCPSGSPTLTKVRGEPFGVTAIQPVSHVSIAMNSRLYRAVKTDLQGNSILAKKEDTTITSRVMDRPYVPLLFDIDAPKAAVEGVDPFYSAPPIGVDDPYASGKYWNPSGRHRGRTNVAFVGGHVLTSRHPAKESWDWTYQAETTSRPRR